TVSPVRATGPTPELTSNTRPASLPLTARLRAPGPVIVRLLSISSWPAVRVTVPVTSGPKVIVAPGDAKAIASRSVQPSPAPASSQVPSPGSAVFVTTGPVATWTKLGRPGRAGPVACGVSVQATRPASAASAASARAERTEGTGRLVIAVSIGEGRRDVRRLSMEVDKWP